MSQEAKKSLRKHVKDTVSALSEDEVASQSTRAQQAITALPQYQQAGRLSIYLSMPTGEARTESLVRDALGAGKTVFVPYIFRPPGLAGGKPQRKVIDMLRLSSVEEFEGLHKDAWGIPSLMAEDVERRENAMGGTGLSIAGETATARTRGGDEGGLDLIVVPSVAFDAGMHRLGHGAGFYDAYLSRLCEGGRRKRPYLVGLCLAEQFLRDADAVPTTESDWKVDAVATGDGRLISSDNGL